MMKFHKIFFSNFSNILQLSHLFFVEWSELHSLKSLVLCVTSEHKLGLQDFKIVGLKDCGSSIFESYNRSIL